MTDNPDVLIPQRRTTPESIAAIKESAGEIARTERQHAKEIYARGKERVHAAQVSFEDYVRQNPLRSILIAVGTGAALGFLFGRRR
jgi:ElaB/YqjD/DUF883 family membrane-anchored ribosome-binding protein